MNDFPETTIQLNPVAGFPVRSGSWKDQEASTYDLFAAELRAGRWENAKALARQSVEEAREPVDLYLAWIPQTRDFLDARGAWNEEARQMENNLLARVSEGRETFEPQAEWEKIQATAQEAIEHCDAGRSEDAIAALERSREMLLDMHDRLCDWVQGMIAIAARQLGEEAVGDLWQDLMKPMFAGYAEYDVDKRPWKDSATKLLYVTAEALRGHLSGPKRRGTIEFIEEEDRLGFRFSPCGSGGRNNTDETYDSYPRTTERHDWAWNMKGVCLYCAHCCALSELNPIETLGYPAREVEPPYIDGEERRDYCTWWVYKDPKKVPASVYRRTGHTKPERIGSSATQGQQMATSEGEDG